jgi:hypothetical protein
MFFERGDIPGFSVINRHPLAAFSGRISMIENARKYNARSCAGCLEADTQRAGIERFGAFPFEPTAALYYSSERPVSI